jgi:hypothetical protein
MTEYDKLKKYCTIEKTSLICKEACYIVLPKNKYDTEEANIDISATEGVEDYAGIVRIPCVFQIVIPDKNDVVDVYLPFDVNLLTTNVQSDKDNDTYYFEPGDIIIHVTTKSSATDIKIVDMLFENRAKHLTDNIGNRVLSIHSQLLATKNIKLHHLETILSNTYISKTDEGDIPVRLTPNQKYDFATAKSTKDAVHALGSSSQAFVYGYTSAAINKQIVSSNKNVDSDLTKVITGQFSTLKPQA